MPVETLTTELPSSGGLMPVFVARPRAAGPVAAVLVIHGVRVERPHDQAAATDAWARLTRFLAQHPGV